MRQELTVAYDSNADLRDRIHGLQQQVAAMRAEAAARTPVGVTIEKVSGRRWLRCCSAGWPCGADGLWLCWWWSPCIWSTRWWWSVLAGWLHHSFAGFQGRRNVEVGACAPSRFACGAAVLLGGVQPAEGASNVCAPLLHDPTLNPNPNQLWPWCCCPDAVCVLQAVSSLQKELESAYQKAARAEADAADARASANRSATLALEMERLTEENAVLGQRFDQMQGDLK